MAKAFLDTNILAYASDQDSPAKRKVARALILDLSREIPPCISTQVVQEFYVTATRKLGIEPLQAKDIIHSFRHFEIVTITLDDIRRAIDGNILWQVSFWDALVIAAAQKARCELLYSEDLSDGRVIDGLEVRNPFKDL